MRKRWINGYEIKNFNRELEFFFLLNNLELKYIIFENKNLLYGFNSRLDRVEDRFGELKNRLIISKL